MEIGPRDAREFLWDYPAFVGADDSGRIWPAEARPLRRLSRMSFSSMVGGIGGRTPLTPVYAESVGMAAQNR